MTKYALYGGLKFDQNLSAYVLVKPHCLIEELFYLTWRREWLVWSRHYAPSCSLYSSSVKSPWLPSGFVFQGRKALVNSKCMLVRVRIKCLWWVYVWPEVSNDICIIGESMTKFCSPKFQVPNMCYRLKFTDVFVAPNYQICIIGGLKFDWNLSAYVLVKPHFLIEEPFYLSWGRERLVRSRQYADVPSILLGRMGRRLAWPQQLQPFWQPLQADKLWVTICMWV